MIIREREDEFVCIEQNHHAHIAKQLIIHWQQTYLQSDSLTESVLYAIEQHDVGWNYFDKQPLWNDALQRPYTFIDLPLLIKTVVYTTGVNIVAARNPYAAALCSMHYTNFLHKYDLTEVKRYVLNEQLRRQQILQAYPEVDDVTFEKHLAILQLADNLSLFICLHEPGNNNYKHRYFQNGIRIPQPIDFNNKKFITASWSNKETVFLNNMSQVEPFSITIKEKLVSKKAIAENGWLQSYEKSPFTDKKINVITA